jgi:hypothetical protein
MPGPSDSSTAAESPVHAKGPSVGVVFTNHLAQRGVLGAGSLAGMYGGFRGLVVPAALCTLPDTTRYQDVSVHGMKADGAENRVCSTASHLAHAA